MGAKSIQIGGVRSLEKNVIGSNQTGSWWCKQAKVLIRPRSSERIGPTGNLIDALNLLANQQEDGGGLVLNIVTNLCEGSRRGLTERLREFIQVDNHRALEVGHLSEGLGTVRVRRPKGSEGYPEVRAEEVGTWKSYINVDHIAKERWGSPLVHTEGHAFCQALHKGRRELYDAYKDMSRAVGVKKPQEAQKAKALWTMKAAKDAGEEEYYDPTREDNILGRNKTRLALWEEHLKDPIGTLDKALKFVENSY